MNVSLYEMYEMHLSDALEQINKMKAAGNITPVRACKCGESLRQAAVATCYHHAIKGKAWVGSVHTVKVLTAILMERVPDSKLKPLYEKAEELDYWHDCFETFDVIERPEVSDFEDLYAAIKEYRIDPLEGAFEFGSKDQGGTV